MTYFYAGAPNWVFSMFAFVGFLCSMRAAWNTGDVSIHDLDRARLPHPLHQLYRLERKHDRLVAYVV
jgi:hypothetical protein